MKIRVLVTLKENVLDPQGQTIKNAFHTLGYNTVTDVRQGKVFEIELGDISKSKAEQMIPEMSDKVLANPIIERFEWQIVE